MDYNAGLDVNIKRRMSVTVDFYRSITENMLAPITLPPSVGFTTMQENVGSVINRGLISGLLSPFFRTSGSVLI